MASLRSFIIAEKQALTRTRRMGKHFSRIRVCLDSSNIGNNFALWVRVALLAYHLQKRLLDHVQGYDSASHNAINSSASTDVREIYKTEYVPLCATSHPISNFPLFLHCIYTTLNPPHHPELAQYTELCFFLPECSPHLSSPCSPSWD